MHSSHAAQLSLRVHGVPPYGALEPAGRHATHGRGMRCGAARALADVRENCNAILLGHKGATRAKFPPDASVGNDLPSSSSR